MKQSIFSSFFRRGQMCPRFHRHCSTLEAPRAFDPQAGHDFSPETQKYPTFEQRQVHYTGNLHIQVGFLLMRQPVVMPDVHPLEHELSNLLQNEYNVYNRHRVGFEMDEAALQCSGAKLSGKKQKAHEKLNVKRNISSSSQNFWKERGVSLDQWGRPDDSTKKVEANKKENKKKDKKEISDKEPVAGSFQANFFNLEGYADGQSVVVNNWNPAPRLTASDFSDIAKEKSYSFTPPRDATKGDGTNSCKALQYISRHTTCRKYASFLYMLALQARRDDSTQCRGLRWSIPYGPRKQGESLRSTLDRLLIEWTQGKSNGTLQEKLPNYSLYVSSNAPQGVFYEGGDPKRPVYVFLVNYTEDHNVQANLNTPQDTANVLGIDFTKESHMLNGNEASVDFNWVTRDEMTQYAFASSEMQQLLRDISISGVGE